MNGPNKRVCYITLGWKGLKARSTLAYKAHLLAMEKMKCCEYSPKDLIQNTSYSLWLINGPNMPVCYVSLEQKGLTRINTLAYQTHLLAMEKMKCCEYCPRGLIQNISYYLELMNGPNKPVCYVSMDRKGLTRINTLAYQTYLLAMEKMKCCEYGTWDLLADRG